MGRAEPTPDDQQLGRVQHGARSGDGPLRLRGRVDGLWQNGALPWRRGLASRRARCGGGAFCDRLHGWNFEIRRPCESGADSDLAPARNLVSGSREYVEAVDIMYLRSEPSGWFYGVALPKSLVRDAGIPDLLPLIAIFVFGFIALIVL